MTTSVSEAIEQERQRCLRCVEVHYRNVEGNQIMGLLLSRIANMIRNGEDDPQPIGPLDDEEDDDGNGQPVIPGP